MTRSILRSGAMLIAAVLVSLAWAGAAQSKPSRGTAPGDLGVDAAGLSSAIDNPYVPFALLKRAVYAGWELDDESGDTVRVRAVVTVRDSAVMMAGIKTTVVEVTDVDGGVLVEKSWDYYAQDAAGAVHYVAARVDDIEKGKVVGHVGQWTAGLKKARAGLLMPATPAVGGAFEPERAPGVAEASAKVSRVGVAVTTPAGSYEDCIEVEVTDPSTKSTSRRLYCRGVGRVRDAGKTHLMELVELELRPAPDAADAK